MKPVALLIFGAVVAMGCPRSPVPDAVGGGTAAAPPLDAPSSRPASAAVYAGPTVPLDSLPPAVAETRRRLLRAARSHDWDEIDAVAAENPAFPDHLDDRGLPPTVAWRSYGLDYAEAMAEGLAEILAGPPRHYPPGQSPNAYRADRGLALYLWPAWAHTPADALTAHEREAVEALRPGLLDEMRGDDDGLYRDVRIEISEDGTWLYLGVAT